LVSQFQKKFISKSFIDIQKGVKNIQRGNQLFYWGGGYTQFSGF